MSLGFLKVELRELLGLDLHRLRVSLFERMLVRSLLLGFGCFLGWVEVGLNVLRKSMSLGLSLGFERDLEGDLDLSLCF